jgi:hypothetical protein
MRNGNYKSSGLKGASGAIKAGPGIIMGIMFVADTGDEPTLTVWDNASAASGDEIAFLMPSDETHTVTYNFPNGGLRVRNGIYAELSAAEGDYIIFYA